QNAIIMRGSPDQLALAQKMIDDIDKAKPEVIVDVVVAQVRRDKVRNIGITPPLNASVSLGPSTVAAPASGSTSSTPGSTFSIKDLEHLKEQNFSFTVDPAKAILSFSDDNGKILQSPRIRAADNEKASLKIQDRLPIATGSFGLPTGIAGATGVGVNTSFSYLDVGITVEITPHVHNNNEVTLKTHLEVSNKTNDVTIGGVQQPQVSTRGIDDQFRLKDGEASLLGGILETSEVVGSSGTPFLGSIPILKYFFSSEKKEKIDNELVILFIPHIVRGQELSDLNRKAIDIGPSTGVSLRMLGKGPSNGNGNTSAAAKPPTNSPATAAPAVPSQPSPPASTPAPVTGLPADGPLSLRLDPGSLSPAVGSTFALNVMLTNGQDISSVPVEIAYDTQLLQFMDVTNGGFLSKDGQSVVVVHRVDTEKGIVRVVAQRPQGSPGISGEGNVLSLMFIAKARGQATVSIAKPGALNSQNQQVQAQTSGPQAAIRVN
ncbi:MAG TPA: cohesin domain-containing protein, partial [Alphaproteobacteria bacterium]|nr:cohesin domain-containing protein [Alphaproteobacteria bacterium]